MQSNIRAIIKRLKELKPKKKGLAAGKKVSKLKKVGAANATKDNDDIEVDVKKSEIFAQPD